MEHDGVHEEQPHGRADRSDPQSSPSPRGRVRAARFLDVLESRLSESPFVSGERFGFADITAAVGLDLADRVELGPKPAHRRLRAWRDQMTARPSFYA